MEEVNKRPGGQISKRTSKVIFVCDTSGSMLENGKIAELNSCLRESIPHIQKIADEATNAEIQISIMGFNNVPKWEEQNKPIKEFTWKDMKANPDGETNIGAAFDLLALEMNSPTMPERGYPPLVVVVTDGLATDNYTVGLQAFLQSKWGAKSVRYGIAIGKDADVSCLTKFINNAERKPIKANNPEQLAKAIRLVSTVVFKQVVAPPSTPPSAVPATPTASLVATAPVAPTAVETSSDVW